MKIKLKLLKPTGTRIVLSVLALLFLLAPVAQASPIDPGLSGNTQYDGWADLTAANNPGYPGFPGSAPWPAPIGSNQTGSGDADLDKVAGNAYPASAAIYFGGFGSAPNTYAGTLELSDATPVADVETIILQVEIGEALGYDFYDDVFPTLSYNGGTQALGPDNTFLVDQVLDGYVDTPAGPQPVYINTWMVQWDARSLGAISDFAIEFSGVEHSQVYALRLDQSDVYAIPEPGSAALCLVGLAGLALASRKRSAAA
jgi:hypothetical protein